MDVVQLQNASHPAALLRKADQMRRAGTLCDVVIVVDSQEFHAHRTMLACTSKMFEILFHRYSQKYTLDFLSPKTFQQILEYAYTASLQARIEDLDDLLYAAEILEIEYLEEQCLKILENIQTSDEKDVEVLEKDFHHRGRQGTEPMKEGSDDSPARKCCLQADMVEQSPSVSTSLGLSPMSPTRVAMDSLIIINQSLPHSEPQDGVVGDVAPTAKPVGRESPRESEPSSSCGGEADQSRGLPTTPTRGSVITSAWEMSHRKGELPQVMESDPCPPALFPAPPNHTDGTLSSQSMRPALTLEMGACRSLLPPGFAHGNFLSPGELVPGRSADTASQGGQFGTCGSEPLDGSTAEQHGKLHGGMKTYGCEQCGKYFLDSLRLRMHLLSHSGPDVAVFCLLCGKRFQTQLLLQQHMGVHARARSYACSQCDRTFPSHTTLRRHLRSHTGDHPFECEFCGSCFRDEASLRGHKRTHTGEKPYECNGCGKKFSLKHQLETHYRVHTGEKPFECKLCHQRSRDYSAMIKHLRTHNGAAPYQCTVCLEFCPSLSAMQKHMKAHKAEDVPPDWRIEKTYLYLCYV
ncbi:zinc finger and BTB domain-containing protein 16-A isoform X3 [Brienomyrus brachyistius]|uniref:zinc finger and BTB domain-containing protein 16-A isoform X3 n=1 Tax=Brienomyrus brachyistius TaxID=42636 RepID=UPI0020B42970|nr:zinc finger and BTB domain-containing protein 16-A isoform X3 [Brienomyrus brachyistius]